MAQFFYRAMNHGGKIVRGATDALNPFDLELRLKRMNLDLITHRPRSTILSIPSRTITRAELITFCFHLEQLMRAKVPILEALTDLRDSVVNPRFRSTIGDMLESIEGGDKLSAAMAQHGAIFDPIFVNLIRVGEQSGNLPDVLSKLQDNLKWQDELYTQTRRILLYPAFVTVVIIGVIFFLMIYMVPQLSQFMKNAQQHIPLYTRILMAISDIFVHYWYLILLAPAVLTACILLLVRRNPKMHYRLDAWLLALPVIGPTIKKVILARFSTYFAMMYAAGVSVLDCIRITEKISGNKVIENALVQAGRHITEGRGISDAFQRSGVFPPLVLRMLRVGETTGELDKAMLNVSYFYDRNVRESIARLQSMIQPALTLFLGALLLWVIVSVLGPIYDTVTKLKF
ncbi:MAG: type II secretion system F family protein [Burkholderiales bacterium]